MSSKIPTETLFKKRKKFNKTSKQVIRKSKISNSTIIKYTNDISKKSVSGLQKIKDDTEIPIVYRNIILEYYKKGISLSSISKELDIPYHILIRFTRRHSFFKSLPMKQINKIREEAKKGKRKIEIAMDLDISYFNVLIATKDINVPCISLDLINKMRWESFNGKTKTQIALEYHITYRRVRYYTEGIKKGIIEPKIHNSIGTKDLLKKQKVIKGRPLKLLKKLLQDGFAFRCNEYKTTDYRKLKKEFPSIQKVNMRARTIYFLEEKADIAIRAYLQSLDKRITNYHDLKRVFDTFKTNMDSEEKKKYVHKKKQKRHISDQNSKVDPSQEKSDSFVNNYFTIYSM